MKKNRIVIFGLSIAVVGLFLFGCAANKSAVKYAGCQEKIEKNTPPFNPAYFKDTSRKHMAVFFDVVNGELVPSKKPAQIRPGRMPYRPKMEEGMIVSYRTADGKELGMYLIDDPLIARSYDFADGKTPEVKRIEKGTVEILVPYDSNITIIEVGRTKAELKLFDVSPQIKEGIRLQK